MPRYPRPGQGAPRRRFNPIELTPGGFIGAQIRRAIVRGVQNRQARRNSLGTPNRPVAAPGSGGGIIPDDGRLDAASIGEGGGLTGPNGLPWSESDPPPIGSDPTPNPFNDVADPSLGGTPFTDPGYMGPGSNPPTTDPGLTRVNSHVYRDANGNYFNNQGEQIDPYEIDISTGQAYTQGSYPGDPYAGYGYENKNNNVDEGQVSFGLLNRNFGSRLDPENPEGGLLAPEPGARARALTHTPGLEGYAGFLNRLNTGSSRGPGLRSLSGLGPAQLLERFQASGQARNIPGLANLILQMTGNPDPNAATTSPPPMIRNMYGGMG